MTTVSDRPTPGRHLVIASVLIALEVWPIGFNLGAYGTVFWNDFFEIWIVSVVTLLSGLYLMLMNEKTDRPPVRGIDLLAMFLPSIWFLSEAADRLYPGPLLDGVQALFQVLTVVFALPVVAGVMLRVTMPEVLKLRSARLNLVLIAITLAICAASYLIGARNDLIFTCEDFRISGDEPPANCFPEQQ